MSKHSFYDPADAEHRVIAMLYLLQCHGIPEVKKETQDVMAKVVGITKEQLLVILRKLVAQGLLKFSHERRKS